MTEVALITGAGGFIGAHMLEHLLVKTDWDIVCLDSFRHKGLTDRIAHLLHDNKAPGGWPSRVRVFAHDLTVPISDILIDQIGKVNHILNFASESHVERSIQTPEPFVRNNVNLMLTMLEYARVVKPDTFVQISTDEVYGPMVNNRPHPEWDTPLPSNPYAASKAAQEMLAISYWRTYNLPIIITNTMNNFGERQDPEKYVPMIMRKILRGDNVTVHGTPGNIGSRYWLHARNHADAVLFLITCTFPALFSEGGVDRPDRYNIVGDQRVDNLEIATKIAKIMDKDLYFQLVDFHSTRPGHDLHYGLTGDKLAKLGWQPPVDFHESLERTVRWAMRPENRPWSEL